MDRRARFWSGEEPLPGGSSFEARLRLAPQDDGLGLAEFIIRHVTLRCERSEPRRATCRSPSAGPPCFINPFGSLRSRESRPYCRRKETPWVAQHLAYLDPGSDRAASVRRPVQDFRHDGRRRQRHHELPQGALGARRARRRRAPCRRTRRPTAPRRTRPRNSGRRDVRSQLEPYPHRPDRGAGRDRAEGPAAHCCAWWAAGSARRARWPTSSARASTRWRGRPSSTSCAPRSTALREQRPLSPRADGPPHEPIVPGDMMSAEPP